MEGNLTKKESVRKCVGGLRQVRSEGVDGGGSKIGGRWRGGGDGFGGGERGRGAVRSDETDEDGG